MAKDEVKILFVYEDFEGNAQIESLWAERIDAFYKIVNIPFFITNISYGDIVSVEEDNGSLYFHELVQPSGHSTIQIIFFNKEDIPDMVNKLIDLGCDWEGSHLDTYIAIDVPAEVHYHLIKEFLEEGHKMKKWDYKEACLGFL